MARIKGPFTLCAVALLVCTVTTTADKCPTGCNGVTPNIFKYQEGTTYKYNLDGNIEITLASAEGQTTGTKIKGTVLLTQQGDCNQVLRLQNVQIIGPDAKKYPALANLEKSIKLNFHDGHIEDEICAEPGDTQNSLNIKRAVASMFQAALKHDKERDVFGDCPNDITSRKEGPLVIIQKSRDLNKCAHRESIKQDFMATSFNWNSEIKASPLLDGDYESEQKVKNGILESAVVIENYLYKPLNKGVKATVTTKLTLAGQNKEKVASKATEPKSIYFENPHQETTKTANVDSILNALKETKKTMDISVSEKSAGTFAQLIRVLKASKKDDILAVYGQVKAGAGGFTDKEGARKVFFDALFRTGTGDAVEVAVELLKSKELSPIETKLVYLSLSFIRHATPASLASAAALLDQPDLPREAYLGLGALAGRYCSEHNCENVEGLNKLMHKLATKLNSQPGNRKQENEVIAILKGLGNVGHLTDNIVDKLVQLVNDKKAPIRIRVAALESALNDACHAKLINAALNILKNRQEDSEIRIKAYLVVVKCPDNKVATALNELLQTEPVYQVGGFIVSHLRNLRASANPDREAAKQILSNVRTTKKFPIDPRKFSFNTEMSYTFDTLGAGNSIENNVIYSQNSFLPRSTSLNLTTELFGHSFNFLEIGARQENLDRVLEHYLGPLGVLNSQSPEELYATGKDTINKLAEHIKARLAKTRGKRDVSKAEIESISKQIKLFGNELNKDLDLDLSVKIFGSELLFLSINEDIQKLTPDAIIDKLFDTLDQGLEKAKSFEYHLKNHVLFLDAEGSWPTSLGLPLRFTLEGASAMHFITSGNIDIRQILKDPNNAELKLNVIPSANIELSGLLSIDAHVIKTGLKVTSNILTSTGTDLSIKLLDNKGVDVKLGLPVENQKLISFSHDIVFSNQELGKPEVDVPLKFKDKPKEFSICFDQLSPVIGLTFCGELNTPSTLATNAVPFPLNGNMKVSLSIEREDVSEYHFRALVNSPNPNSKTLEITFETPKSKTNRQIALLLEATTQPNKMLKATLKSPFKTATLEAIITDNAQEKSAMLRFQHDTTEYYGKIGVSVKGNDAKAIYQPLIEYSTPNDIVKTKGNRKPDYTVEGQVIVDKAGSNTKYTFDKVKLIAPGQPPILIDGYLAKEGPIVYATDIKVSRESVNVGLKGKVQATPDNVKLNAELQNSINPDVNFNVKYELKRAPREFDSNLVLIHGNDLSSKKHVLSLSNSAKYKYEDKENWDFGMKNKVSYPLLEIEGKLDAKASKNEVEYDFILGYDKFKLKSELEAKISQKHLLDYDIEWDVEALNNKVELKAKREVIGDNEKSKIHNSLNISGRKYQLDGTITHHVKTNDMHMGTDMTIKIAGKADPILVNTNLVSNLQQIDYNGKVSIGPKVLVEVIIKGVRGANPSGTLKVHVLDLVDANGDLKVNGGKGVGWIVVAIPKLDRKIKAETQFTCQDPTHNAVLNIFFDFEKDNTKKLHLETNNQITKTSVDSKNKAQLLNYNLEANLKGKLDGKLNDGNLVGEFDVLLPNNHVIAGKLQREIHINNGVTNGNVHASLEHKENKGAPARKIDAKMVAKDCDFKNRIVDLTYNIVAENTDGKNIKVDLAVKHVKNGDRRDSQIKYQLHGSILPSPLEAEIGGNYAKKDGSYKISSKYGPNMAANIHGKYDLNGGAVPISGDIDAELLLPNDKFKNVKLQASGKLQIPQKEDGTFDASGQVSASLNNEKNVKIDGNVKASLAKGNFQVNVNLPNEEPLALGGGYSREKSEVGGKVHGEVKLQYKAGKEVKVGVTINKPSKDEIDLELNLVTPSEAAKNINLQVKNKRSNAGKHFNNEINLTADGKKYSLVNELIISEISPSLDVKISYPDGKTSRIYAKFNRLAPKQFNGEIKVESIKDFSFDASGEANLESVDNFHITIDVNSEKLKLDKVKVEALNKPAKGGKRIQFSVKSGDKNLISGSTSYKANEEGGKLIVEGSGSVKVKEETKTATFKYIRQQLQQEKDGEQGIEILLNAGIGSQGIVGELKLTNKQFRILNSYCEEKKQCAHVEIFSKSNSVDASEFNHELEVNIDLRKLGLSHEFGLKAVTNRKNLILDHTVDIHFESSANSKYQYSLYVHPKEAGIQFTTPKRVISLEAKGDIPIAKNKVGPIKAEIALYMNKNAEPNKKSVLSFQSNQAFDDNHGNFNVEVKFVNPALSKDLSVLYGAKYDVTSKTAEFNIDIDVFGKKSSKITISGKSKGEKLENGYKLNSEVHAVSKGLDLDVKYIENLSVQPQDLSYERKLKYQHGKASSDNALIVKLNPKQLVFLAQFMNLELLHIDAALQLSKDTQIIDAKISGVGIDDLVEHTEIKNWNTIIYTLGKKATPQNKLQVSSGFIFGQIADFRAEVVKGGAKHDLVHASIKLDDANFMKPDFGINIENIQNILLASAQKDNTRGIEEIKIAVNDIQKAVAVEAKQIAEALKKNVPNLKPMAQYYQNELIKLKDELVSDKTIQEVSEFLKKIIGAVVGTLNEIYTRLSELADKLIALGSENFAKFTDVIAKDILPNIKQIGSKILDIYLAIFKDIYDLAMLYIVKLTELLKAHQGELKRIATVMSETFQDVSSLTVKFLNDIKNDIQNLLKNLYEQVKALPIFEELKQNYKDILSGVMVPDQILNMLNEALGTVKEVMPTDELRHFVGVVQDYIGKKLRKEQVDDADALKQIYNSLIKAINSIVKLIQSQSGAPHDYKNIWDNVLPIPLDAIYKLPKLAAVKLSPVNWLLEGDYPSLKQIIISATLNPKEFVPPFTHRGVLVQGQHIFTFDDRHLTFPGKCSYLLAKDAVNGNFSVAGTYKDGALESITFADKHDVVTIKKAQQVTLNGQANELPVRTKELEAFRLYESVRLVSKAGVEIICEPDLNICVVRVNGFYHGQLRGLLGNGNNEPYDDFILPNGKITANEADFGNAYKMSASCGAVKTVDHSAHHANPTCDALFGGDSQFRLCFPFVDPATYRQACEHGMASGIADTEKFMALAYVTTCRHKNVPLAVPSKYLQCTNSEKPVALGDQFSVKVPSKSADVVIVIEQNKNNEVVFKELVQPLVTQLTNELGAKGINDIEFSLIGYGGEYQKWPSHYTSGGKLAFHGKAGSLKFSDKAPRKPIDTGCHYMDDVLEKIFQYTDIAQKQLGLVPETTAAREAFAYPFRSNAVKTIVLVSGHSRNHLTPLMNLAKYASKYSRKDGIYVNLITPLEGLKVTGKDAKQLKNIVGFNEDGAYTLADAKKRGEGNAELRKELDYGNDYAVDYVLGRHDGNIFASNNFVQGKAGQRKQFLQVVSHVIADQMTNTEQHLDCECKQVDQYFAQNVCKVVSTKDKQNRKGGVKG